MAGRIAYYGNITTQGLVLNLDAAIQGSYPKTGSTWFDISNNGNNGTLTNGPLYTRSDYGAIVFDGVDDRVDMVKNSLANGNQPFSVTAWINTNKSTRELFFGLDDQSHLDLNAYNVSGSTLSFHRYNCFVMYAPTGSLITGSIQHIVWTYNGTDMSEANAKMYVNGVMKTGYQFSYSNGPFIYNITSSQANYISNKNPSFSSANQYTGSIYNVQVYNQSLTPFQVWQNFNAYKSRYGIPDIVTDGLVLNLDAGNPYSYLSGSSGTTWTNTVAVSSSISGSLVNGPVYNNGAITFDGVNDYVLTNTGSTLPTNFTIDVWVRPNSSQVQYADILGNHGQNLAVQTWGVVIQQNNLVTNQYGWGWGYGSPVGFSSSPFFNLTANIWTNITIVKTGVSGSTYVNGNLINSFTGSYSTIGTSPLGIMIGTGNIEFGQSTPQGRFFSGNISNTKLYNRALSLIEIQQNFNALRGRYGI